MSDEKYLMRTEGGEAAWKSLDLSLDERRFLSLLKTPLSMNEAKKLAAADPAYPLVLKKGWVVWAPLPPKETPKENPLDRLRQKTSVSSSSLFDQIDSFVAAALDHNQVPLPTRQEIEKKDILESIKEKPAQNSRDEFLRNKEIRRQNLLQKNQGNSNAQKHSTNPPLRPSSSLPQNTSLPQNNLGNPSDMAVLDSDLGEKKTPPSYPKPSEEEKIASFQKFLKHFGQA